MEQEFSAPNDTVDMTLAPSTGGIALATYNVITGCVHDGREYHAGEQVTLPQITGDGLVATGDLTPAA